MSKDELFFYNDVASSSQINLYQWKIDFLMYAAVITCSDIAFAVSWLVHFLMNLKSLYQAAINWTLLYLKRHRDLSLQLSEDNKYLMTSDMLFVNNTADWKSSQSYTMKLFRDLVEW